jgi:sec-independent protein translocase protein TatA
MGGWDAPWHWVVIAILVIALFGYKKLPDAARSLGRSLRIFKTEIKGMTDDDKARAKAREADEPRALPPAEVVKNEVPKARPRPTPSPNGHRETAAKAE